MTGTVSRQRVAAGLGLIVLAAVGGVLAAATIMPIVAVTGVLVRNEADKFTTLSLTAQGLPQRSEILDRYGHLLAYVYSVDMPYYNSANRASAVMRVEAMAALGETRS